MYVPVVAKVVELCLKLLLKKGLFTWNTNIVLYDMRFVLYYGTCEIETFLFVPSDRILFRTT
jgi:hypothetical protein